MKTSFKTLSTLMVATSMALAGCTEKQEYNPTMPHDTTPAGDTMENVLAGTSWVCQMENTYMYEGVLRMDIALNAYLDFNDSTSGELFQEVDVTVPQYPAANQSQDWTEPFTYTYYGDSVVLNCSYFDEEENDTVHYTYTVMHDAVANTLTLTMEDMEEMMGTSQMVFTPNNQTAKRHTTASATHGRVHWHKKIGDMVALTVMLQSLSH